jgi:hypothetical protein
VKLKNQIIYLWRKLIEITINLKSILVNDWIE